MKSDEKAGYAAQDLREHVRNQLSTENRDFYGHAGLIEDRHTTRLLNYLESLYPLIRRHDKKETGEEGQGLPYDLEDTELAKLVRRNAATETVTKAVQEGNVSAMKHAVGNVSTTSDISGYKAIQWLQKQVAREAYVSYTWGHMGTGKTDWNLLKAEIWRGETGGRLASNIRSWKEKDKQIQSFPELKKWMTDGPEGPKLFVFDEASSHSAGRGRQGYDAATKMGPLIRLIRKHGGSIAVIGHDGKDVAPAVRELTNTCDHKPGKKKVEIYRSVENREGKNHLKTLTGVPKTSMTYDTDEVTTWSWKTGEQDQRDPGKAVDEALRRRRDELITVLREQGLSYRDIVQQMEKLGWPISLGTVQNALQNRT